MLSYNTACTLGSPGVAAVAFALPDRGTLSDLVGSVWAALIYGRFTVRYPAYRCIAAHCGKVARTRPQSATRYSRRGNAPVAHPEAARLR